MNKVVGTVVRIFKWASSEELIPSKVYHDLRTVDGLRKGRTAAIESDPVPPVPPTVVDATVPHLPSVVADTVRFQRLTGCRPGEVCGLRPCDVDRTGDVWEYRPQSHLGRNTTLGGNSLGAYLRTPLQLVSSC